MAESEELPEYFYKYRSLADGSQRDFLRDILVENRPLLGQPEAVQ